MPLPWLLHIKDGLDDFYIIETYGTMLNVLMI